MQLFIFIHASLFIIYTVHLFKLLHASIPMTIYPFILPLLGSDQVLSLIIQLSQIWTLRNSWVQLVQPKIQDQLPSKFPGLSDIPATRRSCDAQGFSCMLLCRGGFTLLMGKRGVLETDKRVGYGCFQK